MNQRIMPEFTRISEDIYPAFAAQVPMKLPQCHDSAIELSQEGWTWFSTGALCDPKFVRATLHMLDFAEYQEARD
jgi:hypothetical protein